MADTAGALDALDRLLWIDPLQAGFHERMATLAEARGDSARATRERRAILALRPADPLEARYQLARVLAHFGQRAEARREVLKVLETAPGFEKAQQLLLDLQREGGR